MKNLVSKLSGFFKFGKNAKTSEKKPKQNPYRDWVYIFIFSMFGFMLTISFGVYLFLSVSNGSYYKIDSVDAGKGKAFDDQKLIKSLKDIENRKELFEKIRAEKIIVDDPSR